MFDVAVVGGGITGCMSAYFAQKAGFKTVLYEKSAIAAAASGAAGAFVSPRLGKGGALQQLTNEAFEYAVAFYKKNFDSLFHQSGIYRIAKDEDDAKEYALYASKLSIEHTLTTFKEQKAIFFPQAGAVQARQLCQKLVEDVEVVYKEVALSDIDAKHIILATGADTPLLDIDFAGLRKTWGLRIDTKTDTPITHALHKDISISATKDFITKIGATHEKEVDDLDTVCEKGVKQLLKEAKQLLTRTDFEFLKLYYGTRSAVRDYFPVAGKVVDVQNSLKRYPMICRGIKPRDGIIYRDNIYIIGGTGGRGFVFSPFLAKELLAHIKEQREVDKRINPDRLFYKWARKLNQTH